jgi:hypothetical protein
MVGKYLFLLSITKQGYAAQMGKTIRAFSRSPRPEISIRQAHDMGHRPFSWDAKVLLTEGADRASPCRLD